MLRAIIESEDKKASFDFCGTWEQLEKAVRQVIQLNIHEYKAINNQVRQR